ncbi:transporter substrate-binding domain-containing protein [Maridesulfovibrio sp.]|uniref:substrate-binding periplasmic protein n=1 Tax=Maridesulfovibrio sp. TaxID=2795000 RepID=UPI002A187712|nr:transporter substrate-binding domain-containing protein [Maridesulfovibrio sp.]
MIRKVIFIILSVLFLFSGSAFAGKIHFAEGEWAPYVSKNLPENGFSTEIVRAALKAVGLEPELEYYPWKRSINLVEAGEAAGSFPWSKTPEREKQLLFSDPLHSTREVLFYMKSKFPDGLKFNSLSDLKTYVIGGTAGYWYEKAFKEAGLKVDYVSDTKTSFKKLERGRVDLIPENELVGWTIIKEMFPGQENKFGATTDTTRSGQMYVIFSKDKAELVTMFNEGLKKIKSDGIYSAILKKYNLK